MPWESTGQTHFSGISMQKETEHYKLEAQLELQTKEQYQKELTSSVMQLERKNDAFIKLKEKINTLTSTDSETKSVSKLIENNINSEADFDKFRKSLKNVYPSFFNKLQQQSKHTLT